MSDPESWVPDLAALEGRHLDGNVRGFWKPFAALPGARGADGPDLAYICTGIADRHLNRVLAFRPPAGAVETTIAAIVGPAPAPPVTWWLRRGATPAGIADALAAAGGAPLDPVPVMAIALDDVRPAPLPPGLTIAEIPPTAEPQRRWAATAATAASWTDAAVAGFARLEGGFDAAVYATRPRYLGWVDGAPAATAALCLAGGVAGLYVVATLPAYRRRGLATALVRHALAEARRRGARVAILQSSPEGFPVYAKLGFTTVAWYDRLETGRL